MWLFTRGYIYISTSLIYPIWLDVSWSASPLAPLEAKALRESVLSGATHLRSSQQPQLEINETVRVPPAYVKIAIENCHWNTGFFPLIAWWFSIVMLLYQRVVWRVGQHIFMHIQNYIIICVHTGNHPGGYWKTPKARSSNILSYGPVTSLQLHNLSFLLLEPTNSSASDSWVINLK